MLNTRFSSLPDQVAASIRDLIAGGMWVGTVPGRDRISRDLGVSGKTVEAALRLLQREGVLISQGSGRRRLIVKGKLASPSKLRFAILTFEPLAQTEGFIVEMQHHLIEAGHTVFFTARTLTDLENKAEKVAEFVNGAEADAWVLVAASREVLNWFAGVDIPAFALFGRRRGLSIAGFGPNKIPALVAAAERLVALGHTRIVMIARKARRLPTPGMPELAFLGTLKAHGIPTGNYNLPDWEEDVQGFHRCLETLFRTTPPTALIVDETQFFLAAMQFCSNRGLRIPRDISLICTDDDPNFIWFSPSVSHIRWDRKTVVHSISRWAANVARGKSDRRQSSTKAEFVEGGTIGPAR